LGPRQRRAQGWFSYHIPVGKNAEAARTYVAGSTKKTQRYDEGAMGGTEKKREKIAD
jgi:hypothetical protein